MKIAQLDIMTVIDGIGEMVYPVAKHYQPRRSRERIVEHNVVMPENEIVYAGMGAEIFAGKGDERLVVAAREYGDVTAVVAAA